MSTARSRSALTVLGALLAVTLAGCGGSSGSGDAAAGTGPGTTAPAADTGSGSDAGSSDAPDPCSLTSAADLSAVYGVTFGEGKADDAGPAAERGFQVCKWEDAGGTASFVLQTVASGGKLQESASDLFDQSKDLYPDATDGGAGDKSVLLPAEGGFLAVQGDVFVQGNPISVGGELPAGSAKTVLEAVVAKLP